MTPELAEAYERCRHLHRRYGRTYYLATRLLPARKRRHVHALYGFTRHTDEIVDRFGDQPVGARAATLDGWAKRFQAGLAGEPVDDPLLPAVLHTINEYRLAPADFARFLHSMRMDLEVDSYADYDALLSYMEGSAAAIGTMMLPILGSRDPVAAREPARQLGLAFQLTNFIRDVAEDLDRGRVYLPLADLARFGLSREDLSGRVSTPAVRALIRFEVGRARAHYALAAPGIPMLDRTSQSCIRAAFHLYGGILTEIEKVNYDVFSGRTRVPTGRRLRVALRSLLTPTGAPAVLAGDRA